MKIKQIIKPVAQSLLAGALGLDEAADAYEQFALWRAPPWLIRNVFAHKSAFVRRMVTGVPGGGLLFVHVPKNGGTSVKRALYSSDPGHASARYYEMIAPEILRDYPSMAIIRHPVDRLLSAFDFLLNRGGSDVPMKAKQLRRIAEITTIGDFLSYLERIDGNWLAVDNIARPQWWYIVNRDGIVSVKHLWLLNEQSAEMLNYLSLYGIRNLPHVNRTKRSARSLTPEEEARARKIYAPDFALYDYLAAGAGAGATALYGKPLRAIECEAS